MTANPSASGPASAGGSHPDFQEQDRNLREDRFRKVILIIGFLSTIQLIAVAGAFLLVSFRIAPTGQNGSDGLSGLSTGNWLEMILTKIDEASDLKSRFLSLQEDHQRLTLALEEAKSQETQTRATLRRQQIALDSAKTELKAAQKMVEEAVGLRASEQMNTHGQLPVTSDQQNPQADTEDSDQQGSSQKPGIDSALLADLNRFFSGYSDQKLHIVGCRGFAENTLFKPVMQAEPFESEVSAVLMPDRVSMVVQDKKLYITCFDGTVTKVSGAQETLPEKGLALAQMPLYAGDEVLTPRLCQFLGIWATTLASTTIKEEESEKPLQVRILEKVNTLLDQERGDRYRFKSIENIDGTMLVNVEFEQKGDLESLENTVIAKSCELRLVREHKYLEMIFRDGFLLKNNKRQPFY
ncbi:MAG: hypothetical protein KJ645_03795, partial [Planctomycetes bacterium]|nr:hypothetical protein [Planctomycetota bacterium]